MHAFVTFLCFVIIAHLAWEIVARPEAFAARMRDFDGRVAHAAVIWVLFVGTAGFPEPYAILLNLPAYAAFIWLVCVGVRGIWKAFREFLGKPASSPAPRMSEHELMGLYEDIAKVGRLRETSSRADLLRADELMALVIEQAVGPRRGL